MPDPISPFGAAGQIQPLTPNQLPAPADREAAQAAGLAPQAAVALGFTNGTNRSQDRSKAEAQGQAEANPAATPQNLEDAVEALREYLKNLPSDLQFQPDRESGLVVFKLINPVTREVIRQFPPDELLKMARNIKAALRQDQSGIFLDKKL